MPLTIRSIKNGIKCSYRLLKASLNCPVNACFAAVCRKHIKQLQDAEKQLMLIFLLNNLHRSLEDSIVEFNGVTDTGMTMVDSNDEDSPQLECNWRSSTVCSSFR